MEKKHYHHGNLKEALIEAGIELLNEEGEKHFSLRQVAKRCGVSNAAPYSHFKNKEELLEAMKNHVTKQFTQCLYASVEGENREEAYTIVKLGKSYVMFFVQYPQYFRFLFSKDYVKVDLSMEKADNFPPFDLLKELHFEVLKKNGMSDDKIKDAVISAWAMVHGLAAIATMGGVSDDGDWEKRIEKIIWNKSED